MSVPTTDGNRILMTAEGFERLCEELEALQTGERRRLGELLREARLDGALDDNPALVDLLDEHAHLEQRIATLEEQLAAAEIARTPRDGRVGIGSIVRVRDSTGGDVVEYELVGPLEADAANGRISSSAPVGRALLGRRRGARVEVATPRGPVALDVLGVAPRPPRSLEEAA
jgi:transcription elongation factor GreA